MIFTQKCKPFIYSYINIQIKTKHVMMNLTLLELSSAKERKSMTN